MWGCNIPRPRAAAVGSGRDRSRAVCYGSRTICCRSRRRSAGAGAATQVGRDVGAMASRLAGIAKVEAVHVELVRHVHVWDREAFVVQVEYQVNVVE